MWVGGLVSRTIMNLPKVRSVVSDPEDPKRRLVLFRVQQEGVWVSRFTLSYLLWEPR